MEFFLFGVFTRSCKTFFGNMETRYQSMFQPAGGLLIHMCANLHNPFPTLVNKNNFSYLETNKKACNFMGDRK